MRTGEVDGEWISLGVGITKKICQIGKRGHRPNFWSQISVKFTFEACDASCQSIILRIGTGINQEHRTVEKLAQLMDENETSQFRIEESDKRVSRIVNCTIALVKIIELAPSRHLWEPRFILDVAKSQKGNGVELYKKNNFVDAFYLFSSAIKLLISLEVQLRKAINGEETQNPKDPMLEQVTETIAVLYSNMGACHLQLKNYGSALKLSQEALHYNQKDIKAMYRKASALIGKVL
jgi:tetratricopeptide (TPR) repeat protein